MIVIALPLIIGFAIWAYLEWRKRSTLDWPRAVASVIESSVVQVVNDGAVSFRLEVLYRYEVGGGLFFGNFTESCITRSEAEQLEKSLRGLPLYVRYQPGNPGNYFMDPYADVALSAGR